MRTPCWRMRYSAQYARQLRGVCHAEPSQRWRIHPSMARAAPQRPMWAAEEHRVLQRRSGPCDDATNSVAHPLQRSIACCNSARQVRATTQPQQLPLRCNSASRVATALSRSVRRRNQHCCPSVAAAHRVLQQRSVRHRRTAARERSLLQQCTACCNSVRFCCRTGRRSTCCSAMQRCSLL